MNENEPKVERKVERFVNGQWIDVDYTELRSGDQFKLFEPDGTLVKNGEEEVWKATSDPYIVVSEDGTETFGIECEHVEEANENV